MKYCLIVELLFLTTNLLGQQNWVSAENPFTSYSIRCMYTDSVENVLWVGGDIRDGGSSNQRVLLKYDGANWTSFGYFDGAILDIIRFEEKLYVVGFFDEYNGIPCNGIAVLDGEGFVQAADLGSGVAQRFSVIEDELFVCGLFDEIDGVPCNQICKFDGILWSPFDDWIECSLHEISDILKFQGDYFVGGNIIPVDFPEYHDVFKGDGLEWEPAGGGLEGSFDFISRIEVLNDELYVMGSIIQAAGNAGHGIQKWNGSDWEDVNGGLTGPGFSTSLFVPVRDAIVYNDLLIIGGSFSNAGDIECNGLAIWDGERYCCPSNDLSFVTAVEVYQDTIFIGTSDNIDGQFVNNLAKFTGGWDFADCSTVGVNEVDGVSEMCIVPNPSSSQVEISVSGAEFMTQCTLEIVNLSNQVVTAFDWPIGQERVRVDLSSLSVGCYLVRLKHPNALHTSRLVIGE